MNSGRLGNELFAAQLLAAQQGSAAAREMLLGSIRTYLMLVAEREIGTHLRGRCAPSDIVQETLLRTHLDLKRFEGESEHHFQAWLRKILARQVLQACREAQAQCRDVRREAHHGPTDQLEVLHFQFAADPTPSKQAIANETELRLAAAIQQLKPQDREVFRLRRFDQLSFIEIGERIGKSAEASRKIFQSVLGKLRKALEVDDEQHPL